jgi:hypothetical protein
MTLGDDHVKTLVILGDDHATTLMNLVMTLMKIDDSCNRHWQHANCNRQIATGNRQHKT